MQYLIVFGVGLLGLFAMAVFFGAPYLPTLRPQAQAAFDLLDLQQGQTILELGSGDGKVLLLAAQAGYKAIGIEINPLLVLISIWRLRRYRAQVRIVWGNFWWKQWPDADGVFVFLLDRFMPKLDQKMSAYLRPLASVTFRVPNRIPDAEKNGVFYYDYRPTPRSS